MTVWVVSSMIKSIKVFGIDTSLVDAAPGLCGMVMVFKDRKSAVDWVGDKGTEILESKISEAKT